MTHFLIIGAGAAGLMAARELARAGNEVTVLEARDRCGGRILPLPAQEFGYPAEGGAEFVHGAAPVTVGLMREAGLALIPYEGSWWTARGGSLLPGESRVGYMRRFHQALMAEKTDLPVADFLERHFAEPRYAELRRSVTRMVEGYDAADPHRASTFAIREEWMARNEDAGGRIRQGYGALVDYLAAESRRHGATIRLGAAVTSIVEGRRNLTVRCRSGEALEADAAILTVPLPLLSEIALAPAARERAVAAADIGFGNVVKILLRFATNWWANQGERDLADLSFLSSDATVPTWWTQYPDDHPVLTGWLAGPKADGVSSLDATEIVDTGLVSLAEVFDLPVERIRRELIASRAIDWADDPFARGAYSYATPQTRAAQAALRKPSDDGISFSGEALYAGPTLGTVEAALASGQETARMLLASGAAG